MARRSQSAPTFHLGTHSRVTKTTTSKATRRSNRIADLNTRSSIAGISCLPSSESDILDKGPKRKRPQNLHDLPPIEPVSKKTRLLPSTTLTSYHEPEESNGEFGTYICWGDYFGQWPPMEADRGDGGRYAGLGKRRSNAQLGLISYTQSVRVGESPPPWTVQHEKKMEEVGIIMECQPVDAITSDCKRLCEDLISRDCALPHGPSFERDRILKIIHSVQSRNEARVVRDITPLVVPSPELLSIDGYQGMAQMSEAMNAEWIQCNTICGPRPKPDFVIGISDSAFDKDEKQKLRLSHTSACPNLFPEDMYYPFLICEVKDKLKEAERQSMHSASIAVEAIVQLYKKISAADEVDRKILAFSVVHNDTAVNIFGHFAIVEEQKLKFFRCCLNSAPLLTSCFPTNDWAKSYSIIRAIYDIFFPQHLARITSALSRLPGLELEASSSQLGLDESLQESAASQPTSREKGTFKKPSIPSSSRVQQENIRLQRQLDQQKEEARERKTMMERQLAQMERQLDQQKEEARERKTMMERQLAQQKEGVERQLAQQKEEAREQKTMMERQLDQLITLVKERK